MKKYDLSAEEIKIGKSYFKTSLSTTNIVELISRYSPKERRNRKMLDMVDTLIQKIENGEYNPKYDKSKISDLVTESSFNLSDSIYLKEILQFFEIKKEYELENNEITIGSTFDFAKELEAQKEYALKNNCKDSLNLSQAFNDLLIKIYSHFGEEIDMFKFEKQGTNHYEYYSWVIYGWVNGSKGKKSFWISENRGNYSAKLY